jgi:hypothetical protein
VNTEIPFLFLFLFLSVIHAHAFAPDPDPDPDFDSLPCCFWPYAVAGGGGRKLEIEVRALLTGVCWPELSLLSFALGKYLAYTQEEEPGGRRKEGRGEEEEGPGTWEM